MGLNSHPVTNIALVVLVMSHELGSALNVAIIELVIKQPVHCNDHRFLHFV